MNEVWAFEFSVNVAVPREFAWRFWTNVRNWVLDADIESVELDGVFETGTQGITVSKRSGRIEWRIADVQFGRAVLEFPAPGAVGTFIWSFSEAPNSTRIAQQASLSGERAPEYVSSFGRGLEAGIPAGMKKLCAAMEQAFRAQHNRHE